MSKKVDDLRNIAVGGHGSAGKTSLIDHLLVKTGAVSGKPSVEAGTSICDFDEEEKHHKHSIEAAITHCQHAGKELTLIDTPGYPDLLGQTIGVLRGVDNVLIAIDAHAGIKVNTRRVWKEAGTRGLGRILCITKIDDHNIDFPRLMDSIVEVFGPQCVLFNVPLGIGDDLTGVASTISPPAGAEGAAMDLAELNEKAIETIIESDDEVMEKYFEGQVPSADQLMALAVQGVKAGTLTPVVCVSSKQDVGTAELLDLLASVSLPPGAIVRNGTKDGDTVTLKPEPTAPLAAQVFRTRIDPFVQKLSFIRVISGTIKKDDTIATPGERKGFKVGQLLKVQGEKTEPIDSAGPGEIVAVAKADMLHTGVSLGEVQMPSIEFPMPMVGLAVSPKTRGDETKLSTSLHKLAEEDPTIHVDHDEETHETVLTGMSELHLQLIQERLKRRDHVEIETHEPKVPYRETITRDGEGMFRHKKQSGGAGQFAEVHIRMYPLPEGTNVEEFAVKSRFPHLKHVHYHEAANFLWIDSVVGGTIPGNFMPAIEKGFLERITDGVIAGCKVQNVCVEVHFGKDHPVDSNETAFKMAASKAFAEVFQKSKPALLEPMVLLHITVPADNVGDVSSDLAGRRGQMVGMDSASGGMTTVEAKCPLAGVTTYARTLSSMTGGQGSYSMEFASYEPVPGNVQAEVIANAKVKPEEE